MATKCARGWWRPSVGGTRPRPCCRGWGARGHSRPEPRKSVAAAPSTVRGGASSSEAPVRLPQGCLLLRGPWVRRRFSVWVPCQQAVWTSQELARRLQSHAPGTCPGIWVFTWAPVLWPAAPSSAGLTGGSPTCPESWGFRLFWETGWHPGCGMQIDWAP